MSAVRIVADPKRCVGAGQCVLTVPEVFDQDEDGIVALLTDGTAPAADRDRLDQAARLCPAAAITLQEEETEADPA
ncbi:ferredoxin [Kitasatospora sp. NPDC048298]|uniref:ferredoxin n=1 Tax=Kitasatospora sp. NPDC048298 TaxID=3364049 RepID=UPI00371A702F